MQYRQQQTDKSSYITLILTKQMYLGSLCAVFGAASPLQYVKPIAKTAFLKDF